MAAASAYCFEIATSRSLRLLTSAVPRRSDISGASSPLGHVPGPGAHQTLMFERQCLAGGMVADMDVETATTVSPSYSQLVCHSQDSITEPLAGHRRYQKIEALNK